MPARSRGGARPGSSSRFAPRSSSSGPGRRSTAASPSSSSPRDEQSLKTLGPQYWEGKRFRPVSFGVAGSDRQYIALRTDVQQPAEIGANPYQSAYWSYAGAVFNRSFPGRIPAWYARGIAEVMSNTIVREKEVHVGRPMTSNLQEVRRRALVPLPELLAADYSSHWLTQETDVTTFDANAWALVHYLMFGKDGAFSPKVNQFNRMLYDGKDPDVARQEAFGDMKDYYDGMRVYVDHQLFNYARVPVSVDTREEAYGVRALSAAESAVARGELLAALGRPVEARAFAAEAARADATVPGPWEIEATLLEREKRRDEARAAYAKAADAGSGRAQVYYRLAQLEWAPGADTAANERLAARLEKARALEPDRAGTLSFLADVKTTLGHADEALPLATKAIELEPAESYHRIALARVLWHLNRRDEAVQAARTGLAAADDDVERKRAQDFLDFAARASVPRASPGGGESGTSAPDVSAMATAATRACAAGDKSACAHAAVLQARGQGLPRDTPKALATLEGLCKEGVEDGCIGWAVVLGSSARPADTAKAKELLQAACDRKNATACRFLESMSR